MFFLKTLSVLKATGDDDSRMFYLKRMEVVATMFIQKKRVLVTRRPPNKSLADLWEFPGGKVKEGESDLEAARRELREELGIRVTDVGPVDLSVADPGSDFVIEFLPVAIEGMTAQRLLDDGDIVTCGSGSVFALRRGVLSGGELAVDVESVYTADLALWC